MVGKTNAGSILGFINVACQYSSTVTITNGSLSFTETGTTVNFKLPRIGSWSITAAYNGMTQTRTVTVSSGQTVNVTIEYEFYLYNRGTYHSSFASGWSAGNQGTYIGGSGSRWGAFASVSTGTFDLTQYKTVIMGVSGYINDQDYGTSAAGAQVWSTSGTALSEQNKVDPRSNLSYNITWNESWTYDVTNINQAVKFRIYTAHWSGGGELAECTAGINLYSIKVISR